MTMPVEPMPEKREHSSYFLIRTVSKTKAANLCRNEHSYIIIQ